MMKKTVYQAPETEVVVLRYEGIICASEASTSGASFDNNYDNQSWD